MTRCKAELNQDFISTKPNQKPGLHQNKNGLKLVQTRTKPGLSCNCPSRDYLFEFPFLFTSARFCFCEPQLLGSTCLHQDFHKHQDSV